MSDAGVTVKFFGDVTSINAALAKLEQKQETLARAQERNAAKARSVQDEQVVAAVKAHEKEAKAAEKAQLESMRRREQAASKLKILEIKAVEEAASAVKRAEAEKLAYKQGVIARVKAMEEAHARASKANFLSSSGRGQTASRFLDEGQVQKQKNIAAAIKLNEIRAVEEAASAVKRAEADKLSYKQGVIARAKAMEESHAATHKAGFISTSGRGLTASRFIDEKVALELQQKRLGLLDREVESYKRLRTERGSGISAPPTAALAGGVGLAAGLLANATGGKSREFSDDVSRSALSLDELHLKLMQQAGLSEPEAYGRMLIAGRTASKTPSIGSFAGAVEQQTWLESADLNRGDVESGRMLESVAIGLAQLNAFGKDKGFQTDKESVRSIVGGAKAFGLGDTSDAVSEMASTLAMGFKVSAMEAQHLPSYLKEGAAYSAFKMTPEQSMGIFSTMVSQGMPSESAAVGLRMYATKLADVKPDQERDDALKALGLKQSDVQVTSENNIFRSMSKMQKALSGKTEAEQQTAISQIFGNEQFAPIGMMLRDQEKMLSQYRKILDKDQLAATVEQFREHSASKSTRRGINTEVATWQSGIGRVTWGEVESQQKERFSQKMRDAETPLQRTLVSVEDRLFATGNWLAKSFGHTSPEGLISGDAGGALLNDRKTIIGLMERVANASEITASKSGKAFVNRNGNVERNGIETIIENN